jgi:hypothetical protein
MVKGPRQSIMGRNPVWGKLNTGKDAESASVAVKSFPTTLINASDY